ncbi:MAG: hypothetical protein K8I27_05660 [Planctomycetes bacterium]|nr:hypothetical protein [Planctomycetota bacterium]
MQTDTAGRIKVQLYGAWYAEPGGLLFEREDRNDALAMNRLRRLRESPASEPRYSHRKVVIAYAAVGLIHLPLAILHAGAKLTGTRG